MHLINSIQNLITGVIWCLVGISLAIIFSLQACSPQNRGELGNATNNSYQSSIEASKQPALLPFTAMERAALDSAIFAGGCFWCVEAALIRIQGVEAALSGYSGGEKHKPTYREVSAGKTKHAEAVKVYFNPTVLSYTTLLDVFFTAHNPTQLNRQGPDVGAQYRSAIFFYTDAQKQAAKAAIAQLDASGTYSKPVVTLVEPAKNFYPAEKYHQNYYALHPTDSYIKNVSRPKVEKVEKQFNELLKPDYK